VATEFLVAAERVRRVVEAMPVEHEDALAACALEFVAPAVATDRRLDGIVIALDHHDAPALRAPPRDQLDELAHDRKSRGVGIAMRVDDVAVEHDQLGVAGRLRQAIEQRAMRLGTHAPSEMDVGEQECVADHRASRRSG
jgi:hypothetical protein